MKKPVCLRLISPGWISDSTLLFCFSVSFIFFSAFLSVADEVSEVGEVEEEVRGGWGEASS